MIEHHCWWKTLCLVTFILQEQLKFILSYKIKIAAMWQTMVIALK